MLPFRLISIAPDPWQTMSSGAHLSTPGDMHQAAAAAATSAAAAAAATGAGGASLAVRIKPLTRGEPVHANW